MSFGDEGSKVKRLCLTVLNNRKGCGLFVGFGPGFMHGLGRVMDWGEVLFGFGF